jgi:hypothetical protein
MERSGSCWPLQIAPINIVAPFGFRDTFSTDAAQQMVANGEANSINTWALLASAGYGHRPIR